MSAVRRRAAAALGAALAAGCTEVNTAPDAVLSIQFDSLPATAVVLGDSMRGESLVPVPVRAVAYNARGDSLVAGAVRLVPLDDSSAAAFTFDSATRLVTGVRRTAAVRVVARAGDVQSQVQTFSVVPAPTTLTRPDPAARDSIIFDAFGDTTNRSRTLSVSAVRDSSGTLLPVNGVRVAFRILRFPSATRFDSVVLGNASTGRRTRSAIQGGGTASIRLRPYAKLTASTDSTPDTVVVEALFRVRRDTLRRQMTVRLVPRQGARP